MYQCFTTLLAIMLHVPMLHNTASCNVTCTHASQHFNSVVFCDYHGKDFVTLTWLYFPSNQPTTHCSNWLTEHYNTDLKLRFPPFAKGSEQVQVSTAPRRVKKACPFANVWLEAETVALTSCHHLDETTMMTRTHTHTHTYDEYTYGIPHPYATLVHQGKGTKYPR